MNFFPSQESIMNEQAIGKSISELETPCFLVDIERVNANCDRMISKCKQLGVAHRAHMKTAKTLEAGVLQTGGTKRCIAVSTLAEAEFFASGGFDDILYTNSPTEEKIRRCVLLLEKIEKFHLMLDSVTTVDMLELQCPPGHKWSVFMKVDTGYSRAGILWNDPAAVDLARRLSQSSAITFKGVYTHEGNSYEAKNAEELRNTFDVTSCRLSELVDSLQSKAGIQCEVVSMGATPTCSRPGVSLGRINELHAGNYVFYDYQQCLIGSCDISDIACKVAARIIGSYPTKGHLLVDCGFTALSHDGKTPSGLSVFFEHNSNLKLARVTQEVGKVCGACEGVLDYSKYPIGSVLFIYPYHSCATAGLHPVYYVHRNGRVVETWCPVRGW